MRKEVSLMAKLTDKQRRFVEEYLIDLNATQAAIRAGYSVKTAKEIAAQNLTFQTRFLRQWQKGQEEQG